MPDPHGLENPLPDLRYVKRLLIIRLSAIGDVVHSLPLSAALKEAYPHLEITWIVEEIPAQMVLGNPYLHDVIVIPRSRWKKGRLNSPKVWVEYFGLLADLRRRRFDVTIDLQGYAKTALLALATGAKHRLSWFRMRDGASLVSRPIPKRPSSLHRVDWFLDVARALSAEPSVVRFPIQIPDESRHSVEHMLVEGGIDPKSDYVVINQTAGNPPRRWEAVRYAELAVRIAEKYSMPSVFIGTLPESEDCRMIVESVTTALKSGGSPSCLFPINLAGKTDLKQLAALLNGCALHICGDTGSTHIAAGLGRPVLAFYGSTDPVHAGPWGQMDHVLQRRDLCHAECTIRQCAYAQGGSQQDAMHSACMDSTVSEALLSINSDITTKCTTAYCLTQISVSDAFRKVDEIFALKSESK